MFIGTAITYYYENEKKNRMERMFKEVAVTGKPDLGGPLYLLIKMVNLLRMQLIE